MTDKNELQRAEKMPSDIEIAQRAKMIPVDKIASSLGIDGDYVEMYGKYKAKLSLDLLKSLSAKNDGKLILVTAITPTPAGEGKTTTTIGLADGLKLLGKNAVVALREPSLGPVFGVKGGAAGGGYAQVVPMEDINLHFTGDFHAIGAANNLLAAMIDNHIHHGNALKIDPRKIIWKRCVDMNDRQLRFITDGLGGAANGTPREDGFDITVASEVMAVLCLSDGIEDLKTRLGNMLVAYTYDGSPVYCRDLNAQGAMTVLLKDAIKPNLCQTLGGTPAFIHGGPFANIAHGCNSVVATKLALKLSDYCVTEAGFGADLGAEKFLDIKCPVAGIKPDCVVIVATVRALKMHGGALKTELDREDTAALSKGFCNLKKHVENITKVYTLPAVVAINRFAKDSQGELDLLLSLCTKEGYTAVIADGFSKGGAGMTALAEEVLKLTATPSTLSHPYTSDMTIAEKLTALATKVYGADKVSFSPKAARAAEKLENLGYGNLPLCVAKTQYSLSDDPLKLGAPSGFVLNVKDVKVSAGAGFIVIYTGDIMTMPGLPTHPAAENIDLLPDGTITGLF